jgi:hypothetical protein
MLLPTNYFHGITRTEILSGWMDEVARLTMPRRNSTTNTMALSKSSQKYHHIPMILIYHYQGNITIFSIYYYQDPLAILPTLDEIQNHYLWWK